MLLPVTPALRMGFVVEWLTFADFTPEQLMNLARANDWIKEGETWPLSEERCANFLDGDNWDLIAGELDALKYAQRLCTKKQ
jgi:hypothetical protein